MKVPFSNRLILALKITRGLFLVDHNKTVWGRVWQLFSRFTWELPQTLVGWLFAMFRAFAGQANRVDTIGGITYVTHSDSHDIKGVSMGSFVHLWILFEKPNANEDFVLSDSLYMHEFGHTLDSRRLGLAYLFVIGIPSLVSASGKGNHSRFWTEIRANRQAKRYFTSFHNVNWDDKFYPVEKKK